MSTNLSGLWERHSIRADTLFYGTIHDWRGHADRCAVLVPDEKGINLLENLRPRLSDPSTMIRSVALKMEDEEGDGALFVVYDVCQFCEKCRAGWPDLFMVWRDIWREYGNGDALLCFSCLEDAMGRQITPFDLLDLSMCPVNRLYTISQLRERSSSCLETQYG